MREIFSRFVPLRGILSLKVVGDINIETFQMSIIQMSNLNTSTSHHFNPYR